MRKLLNYLATKEYFALYFGGLLCLLVSTLLEPSVSMGTAAFWMRKAASLLDASGYVLIITTLVSSVLNFFFLNSIEEKFSIVGGAEAAHIRRLYPDRAGALRQIKIDSERAIKTIDIQCISGTDLLHPKADMLQEIDRRCAGKNGIYVRILILDPRSHYAIERSLREENQSIATVVPGRFEYPSRKLCRDTMLALQQIDSILEQLKRHDHSPFRLEVRLYNSAPMMHYVRIDDSIFVEQYHLGVAPGEVVTARTRCLGKIVPVVETLITSPLGAVAQSHFEYLWERSARRNVVIGCHSYIDKALREENLFEAFLAAERDEDKRSQLPANPALNADSPQA